MVVLSFETEDRALEIANGARNSGMSCSVLHQAQQFAPMATFSRPRKWLPRSPALRVRSLAAYLCQVAE